MVVAAYGIKDQALDFYKYRVPYAKYKRNGRVAEGDTGFSIPAPTPQSALLSWLNQIIHLRHLHKPYTIS
jgi:hypothetical protein